VGIYDRDWYKDKKAQDKAKDSLYDPKQFRREKSGYKGYRYEPLLDPAPRSNKRPPSLIRSVGTWLLVLFGFTLLFHFAPHMKNTWNESRKAGLSSTYSPLAGHRSCNPSSLPTNGATQVADPSRMRRTDVLFSGLEIANKHKYPVVAYLTDLGTGQRILGVSVPAGKTAQTSVPVGHYGLYFFAGSVWCNDQIGFEDGSKVNIQGGVDVQSGRTSVLSLSPSAPTGPEKFRISMSQRLPEAPRPVQPAPEVGGQGFVDLAQRPDGHYYASGNVNGMPMVFMLDTGATLTSLSQEMASKSGISSCAARTFNTANGTVQGCVAKAPKIQIGSFILRDFEVAIMPNLPGGALLGMNVLRLFRLEQQGGVMRISIR
jgi:clan AA aspartic protease (TIGR02281 family)